MCAHRRPWPASPLTSDVVVTTPTGFATMIVGRERKAFFEEALQQFDVVLFDEADRVQVQLDGCFAPSMSFQELIRNAADPTAVAMKRRPDDKMRDFNEELFYDLRQKSEPVAKALLKSVRDDRVAKWRIVKDEAFTSLLALNDLLEQGLPKQVYEDADKLINPYRFEIAKEEPRWRRRGPQQAPRRRSRPPARASTTTPTATR